MARLFLGENPPKSEVKLMKKMRFWNRSLSLLLVVVMLIGLVPALPVAAAEETEKDSVVLDFMAYAQNLSAQKVWRSMRTTAARGVKAIGLPYGEQPTTKYTQTLKDLEKWMQSNCNWSIPDMYDGSQGHYNHPYGARRIYVDSYSGNYGIRLYTDYPGNGYGECKFTFNFVVPAGGAGTYKMLVETFDEALNSVVASCEGSDNGGATASFYLNDEQVGEQTTFASDEDAIVEHDFLRVELKEGTNVLRIIIDGDRNGNPTAGRCALNLRSISFVDPGPECPHEETKVYSVTNNNRTHETIEQCEICGEKIDRYDEDCADGDDNDTLCDGCGYDLYLCAMPETDFGKDSVVLDFMTFASDLVRQPWFYQFKEASKVKGPRAIGVGYGGAITEEHKEAIRTLQDYLDENYCWNIEDLTEGNPYYLHNYSARRLFVDPVNDYFGIRFYTDLPGNTGSDAARLKFVVNVPKSDWYDMDIETFNEMVPSVIPTFDGPDNGGGTCDIIVNGEVVLENHTFKNDSADAIENVMIYALYLEEGINSIEFFVKGDRGGANGYAGRCAVNLRSIELIPVGPCQHLKQNKVVVKNERDHTHTVDMVCTCREVISTYTEDCVDKDDNKICDICEQVLQLRPAPTKTFSEDSIVLDFMQFAYEAVRQEWWYDLWQSTLLPSGKSIGVPYGTNLTAAQEQAIIAADQYMRENQNWYVTDMTSGNGAYYTSPYGSRHIMIDSLKDEYGIRFYSHLPGNTGSDVSKLNLTFIVPEGKAGRYAFDVEALNEAMHSQIERHNSFDSGGATTNISINGSQIAKGYTFIAPGGDNGSDEIKLLHFGPVELKEGENTLTIDVTGDVWQIKQGGRACFNLRYIEFKPLAGMETQEYLTTYLDLNEYYMAYGASAAGFTVQVEDPWVATANINAQGVIALTGAKAGTTNLKVFNGSKLYCTIPVTVTAFDGNLDDLMGNGLKMDFVTAIDRAEEQSWWNGTCPVAEDGDFNDYLKANTKWNISKAMDITANGDDNTYGFKVKGENTFDVELPASGLYNVTVEYLQGGGKMDVSINGNVLYAGLDTDGEAATIKRSLGTAVMNAGENTITISAEDAVYLRSVTITPLGVWQTEIGISRYLDLNESYLAYDETMNLPGAVSADTAVATANFSEEGFLVITGKSEGLTTVKVTDGGKTICTLDVSVIKAGSLQEVTYTLDGFNATTLKVGETAVGNLSAVTTNRTALVEAYIRDAGNVYFKSSDTKVATVDQATGDVTCVGEGTAVISAYALFDGVSANTSATITVTDDTDLASIEVAASVDYVGVGNTLVMTASGKKASGVRADMSLYPVTWTVDDPAVATITADGRLTGHKEGTVTVTATAGVQRVAITDTMVIKVVASTELLGKDQFYDFVWSRNIDIQDYTMDTQDIAINRSLTTGGGNTIKVDSRGINFEVNSGDVLALDFRIRISGWYEVELRGSQEVNAVYANGYVDDTYIGDIEFYSGGTNKARGGYNTMWLDAGIHTLKVVATEKGQIPFGGVRFYATTDPNEVELELTADKTQLILGQKATLSIKADPANDETFTLMQQAKVPNFTNYYILSSSDSTVLSISGQTVTAKSVGTADVVVQAEVDGKTVTKTLTISVVEGAIADVGVSAQNTTVRPDAESFPLTVSAYNLDGKTIDLPAGTTVSYEVSDESIIKVDANGNVTPQGKEGSAKVTVSVDEKGHILETSLWITTTVGKTEPTVWTYEERANARENVQIYAWAWSEKDVAVARADMYVAALDILYEEVLHPQTWPGNNISTFHNSSSDDGRICPMCETDLTRYNAYYPWVVDPINNPWKISCPHCKAEFPSNDFQSYYRSGLGEDGKFHKELADPQYLVNELYPEKGEGWGVDDGSGWYTGRKGSNGRALTYTFVSHFIRKACYPLGDTHNFLNVLDYLGRAYLYTGDEKYGNAGAILVDRLADIYPTWDISDFPIEDYSDCDGNGGGGYQFGETWDGEAARFYAKATDAFWDCMDNQEVIDYIAEHASWKGMTAEEITPAYLRTNMEENLLLHIWEGLQTANVTGNFGMPQSACAYTAVALDRLPETQDMLDWLYQYREMGGSWLDETSYATGGGLLTTYVGEVKRDGLGNEGSLSYNSLWEIYNVETFEALKGYERVASADMWKNSKVVTMYHSAARLMNSGMMGVNLHETSGSFQHPGLSPNISRMTTAFVNTGDRTLARAIYAFNGNSTDGIHGDIFTKNPEYGIRSQIEKIVQEDGEWVMGNSDMMPGYGMAFLREGPAKYLGATNAHEYSQYVMYYGDTKTDHHKEHALHMDLAAFGLTLSGDLGYPLRIDSNPERLQWVANTISGNTVTVNDRGQMKIEQNGFPMHFADDGKAKVMDADVSKAYEETEVYRRTVVAVENGDGVHYAIDFFRVLGGSEHVYSFHAASLTDPTTEGLDLIAQPMGTYEGADIPFGYDAYESSGNGCGSGYSWLYNVARDDSPDTVFSVDWPIKDFYNQLTTTKGIRLKLTMLSEQPLAEVATADGNPPQDGENPTHLEYVLVRNSGSDGLDTLFTAVLEPYQFENYIEKTELVSVELIDGTEKVTDRAAAVKVTLKSGRVDYIVYATNTECTYRVADLFDFRGFTGVVSYEGNTVVYAWGDEAAIVTDQITDAMPRVTGEVLSFTEGLAESYKMTVSLDQEVTEEQLLNKWIYVNNDGFENAAYRIDGVDIIGRTAEIDLTFQTLIRGYVDEKNLDLGFKHNIAVGNTYEIPLSTYFAVSDLFTYAPDQVVKAGSKLSLTVGVSGAGVTYALDGAPSGMSVNPATGAINWTTSKTQTGRYPITVKAVDAEGNTLATMSFMVYVVSYSGSSYDPAACAHSKAVTYTVGGVTETVCPACGTITKEGESTETVRKFALAGSNMTLGNELAINFLVNKADYKAGQYAVITHNGVKTEVPLTKYNASYYGATYKLAAKMMSDELRVVIMAEGKEVSAIYRTSVRAYAMKLLDNSAMSAKVKTMVVDMLGYGAEAQIYFGYNKSDLANSLLTAAQKALATASVSCTNKQVKGKNFVGSNLSLEDKILLNMMFKGTDTAGMYAEISYVNYRGAGKTFTVDAADFGSYGSHIKITVDELVLADAFQSVSVTLYNADGTVYGTGTDSVESYVARSGNSALSEAIVKFAYSAREYLS